MGDACSMTRNLMIDEYKISIEKNVVHRFSKRDKGELYEPFEVLPIATTKMLN